MAHQHTVVVTVPSLKGTSSGNVVQVWHAVDGVRVEVNFPKGSPPLLPVGRAGELTFSREDTGETVTALGKVAFRGDASASRSYHFLFGERTRQSLASLLEPRRAFRVHPDPDEPVEVTLNVPGATGAIIGAARDVSTSGIGMDIPWEHEAALSQRDEVSVRLRLPGDPRELDFVSVIRNRCLGAGAIVYGLEFELEGIGQDDPRIVALGDYVARRSQVVQRAAATAPRQSA